MSWSLKAGDVYDPQQIFLGCLRARVCIRRVFAYVLRTCLRTLFVDAGYARPESTSRAGAPVPAGRACVHGSAERSIYMTWFSRAQHYVMRHVGL